MTDSAELTQLALEDRGRSSDRENLDSKPEGGLHAGEVIQVPRLWATFATAWLLVLVITIGQLLRQPIESWRLVATLADLAMPALRGLSIACFALSPTSPRA